MAITTDGRSVWMILLSIVMVFSVIVRGGDSSSIPEGKSNCSPVMTKVVEAAYSGIDWALEMIDASGKPPPGIKRQGFRYQGLAAAQVPPGSIQFLGNYDQCLGVETTEEFGTSYCRVHLQLNRLGNQSLSPPKNLYVDICAADICEGSDLVPFAQSYVNQIPAIAAKVQDAKCHQTEKPITYKAMVVGSILGLILALVVIGTLYDVIVMKDIMTSAGNGSKAHDDVRNGNDHPVENEPGIGGQLLLSFSLYTNIPNMLSTNMPKGSLPSVNGVRVLATTWIIIGHIYLGEPAMENLLEFIKTSSRKWSYQLVTNFILAVDTFFVMSGLLLTYKTMRQLETKKPTLDYFKGFFYQRYLRLTPAYLLFSATYISLFKYVSTGPFWFQGGVEPNECEHNCWRHLLYVNNFAPMFDICMIWTWSLSMEMQLFALSPLILLPLYHYEWRGLYVPILVVISSVMLSGGLSYYFNLMPVAEIMEGVVEYWRYHYTNPLVRLGPYTVGMVTGYILCRTDCKAKLSKNSVVIGWTLAIIGFIWVFGAVYGHNNGDRLGPAMASIYNALHRTVWGMVVAWIIFACSCGYGGVVSSFLSWRVFIPFAAISYCTYLSHPATVAYFFLSQRRMFYVNDINMIFVGVGIIVVAYGVAAVTHLLFEAPFAKLDRAIRNIKNKNTKAHQS